MGLNIDIFEIDQIYLLLGNVTHGYGFALKEM